MSADWARLTDHLSGLGDSVTLTWSEFDEIVGGLPASAINHYPQWWHGDRPNTRAWRAAGFEVVAVTPGHSVRFVRPQSTSTHRTADDPAPSRSTVQPPFSSLAAKTLPEPDALLISCVKTKLSAAAAAKDLYVSAYFRKMRRYAEESSKPWFILSAEHGLVSPDDWLVPYERYLPDTPASYRAAWAERVVSSLRGRLGVLEGRRIQIHAGAAYVDPLRPLLERAGCDVDDPLAGLSMGRRLSWYGQFGRH